MPFVSNFDAENRSGFYVSDIRKRLWNVELEIYDRFKKVCDEHGLKHFLIGGSAIGAIRHAGFIPWDDDIDIGMMRSDFDKFVRIAPRAFCDQYSITYGVLGNRVSPLLRIRDKNTTGIIRNELGATHNKGIFIEIYVYDFVPISNQDQISQIEGIERLEWSINYKLNKHPLKTRNDIATFLRLLRESPKSLWDKVYDLSTKYTTGEWVNTVQIPVYAKTGECLIHASIVDDIITTPFENTSVCILSNSDEMLRQAYGDYMQLPPVEERGLQHQNIVFYDPNHPYKFWENDSRLLAFFEGKYEGLL